MTFWASYIGKTSEGCVFRVTMNLKGSPLNLCVCVFCTCVYCRWGPVSASPLPKWSFVWRRGQQLCLLVPTKFWRQGLWDWWVGQAGTTMWGLRRLRIKEMYSAFPPVFSGDRAVFGQQWWMLPFLFHEGRSTRVSVCGRLQTGARQEELWTYRYNKMIRRELAKCSGVLVIY